VCYLSVTQVPIRRLQFCSLAALFAAGCGSPAPVAPVPDASDATAVEGSSGSSESGIVGDSTMSGSDDSMPSADDSTTPFDGGTPVEASDAPYDGPITGSISNPCSLPGSVVRTMSGVTTVPGGKTPSGGALPDVSYIDVPVGFCVHYFANVGNARQIRFAPGGEAFVASPTGGTTSGGQNGLNAIVVLPDDDNDGVADKTITFLNKSALPGMALAYTQGMLFNGGYFYYQDGNPLAMPPVSTIRRIPYAPGQRAPSGPSELVVDIGAYHHQDGLHWVKALDVADDGTIYVGNGGSQTDSCVQPPWPFLGGILKLDGTPGGSIVARGLRNPNAVRCSRGHDLCFALELAKDYSGPNSVSTPSQAGREKLIAIHQGDDWGFPCCATQGVPYADPPYAVDCSGIAPVDDSFLIGDTPFGLDFESGLWPGMWAGRVFIANHGAAGTWTGARLVAIAMDPTTGLPLPGTNYTYTGTAPTPDGGAYGDMGNLVDFATGWDNAGNGHGRPTAVSFSPDGRLFLTNDTTGDIVWIAPASL
jgi:glucose/arabinose dehydrogenase